MARTPRIEDFCKKLTDAEWEALSAEMAAIGKDEEAEQAFTDKYGFKPTSIRGYELQHYIELEKRETMLQEQRAELLKTSAQGFPPIRAMKGSSVKANFYATQESLDAFNALVDEVVELYGFKRYLAVAFVLEEAVKRIGTHKK